MLNPVAVSRRARSLLQAEARRASARRMFSRYSQFTMIPRETFVENIVLCQQWAASGCIVECGVWRGGMSAGMADTLPGRSHFLFDSFEGLPPAREIDGPAALAWQADIDAPGYHDNCSAEKSFSHTAMAMSRAGSFELIQGWFSSTLPGFRPPEPIGVLRLDADWYDLTMDCLVNLYRHVAPRGLIILDDYHQWDGCSRALHDFLAAEKRTERICQSPGGVCFMLKQA